MRRLIDWFTLRRAMYLDALGSGGFALIVLALAGWLAGPLGLPEALLRWVGVLLLPYAAFVAWAGHAGLATAARLSVAANLAWVAASLALPFTGWVAPTGLGIAFILAQAAAVGLFAEMQITALRRPPVT